MWKIMICGTCNKRPGIYHDLKYFTWRERALYGPSGPKYVNCFYIVVVVSVITE